MGNVARNLYDEETQSFYLWPSGGDNCELFIILDEKRQDNFITVHVVNYQFGGSPSMGDILGINDKNLERVTSDVSVINDPEQTRKVILENIDRFQQMEYTIEVGPNDELWLKNMGAQFYLQDGVYI